MEKGKPRGNNNVVPSTVADELAVIKSAAWAWYERGSGLEGGLIRESDVWRTKIDPKPSRYKLEAMRNHVQQNNPPSTTSSSPRSSTTNTSRASTSLLDEYEIARISKQLNYYMEASRAKYHGGSRDSGGKRAAAAVVEEPAASEVISYKPGGKNKLLFKGIWLKNPVICGSSRNDMVRNATTSFEDYSRRRRPP